VLLDEFLENVQILESYYRRHGWTILFLGTDPAGCSCNGCLRSI